MIIKVCGMHQEENVLQLIQQASPDLMGVIFYEKSPRFVEQNQISPGFFRNLPIQKVGVFVNSPLEYVHQKVNDYGLAYVQLHGDEDLEYMQTLRSLSSVKIIKVVRVGDDEVDWQELKKLESPVDIFLFDTQTEKFGGSGKQFNWSVLERYPLNRDFILSGGVNGDSLGTIQALAVKIPWLIGVDINSKFERAPGIKDIDRITTFIQQCRGSLV